MKNLIGLFTLILVVLISGCMKEIARREDILPPPSRSSYHINYQPIQLANDCIKLDSITAFYDTLSNIAVEFEITDKLGEINYFGGTYEQNQHIWCYLADSINGAVYPIKEYHITEYVQEINATNAIGILLDHSGSMGDDRTLVLQRAVYRLCSQKAKDDGFFIMKFDTQSDIEVPFSNDKEFLKNHFLMNGIGLYGGNTALNSSVDLALTNLETVTGYNNKVIFLFTDGQENSSEISMEEIVQKAEKNKVKIFTIGFGEDIDENYMSYLATSTGGKYYHIYQTVEFQHIFNDIYSQLLIRPLKYRIEYKPKGSIGQHFLKLRICLPECTFDKTIEAIIRERDVLFLNVLFEFDKADLKQASFAEIDKVAGYLKSNPTIEIRLEGHTDCIGSREHNLKLSKDRAEAVKKALKDRGVEETRITTVGYGFDRPYKADINDNKVYWFLPIGKALTCDFINKLETSNQVQIAHSLNRRTQLVVVKK